MSLPLILRIFKNDQIVEVKQFYLDQIVIGKNAEVDLDLDDSRISAIHALVEKREDRYFICDLGSQNGTFKNGVQVIDEPLDSGDEIQLGSFKIIFNIGVPRPKSRAPSEANTLSINSDNNLSSSTANDLTKTVPIFDIGVVEKAAVEKVTVPDVLVESVEQKPALEKAIKVVKGEDVVISIPKIKKDSIKIANQVHSSEPRVAEIDLNKVIKPGKGGILEVSFAWQDRIVETYHFSGNQVINVGSKKTDQICLPDSLIKNGFRLIELQGSTALVNVRSDMVGDLILAKTTMAFPILETTGRLVKKGLTSQLRLEQGEALRIAILGGQVNIYIRFVQQSSRPILLPLLPFSVGEIASLLLAFTIVGLLSFYISINAPIEVDDQAKQEELLRMAQIIYQKPKSPPPDFSRDPVPPPPVAVKAPPPKPVEVKKVEIGDKTQAASSAGNQSTNAKLTGPQEIHSVAGKNSPGRAAEIRAKPNGHASKKFSGSNTGGSIKLGDTAGSNAKASTQVDLSKLGAMAAFGSGGIRQKMDQAVAGAGGIMGDASTATGSSGYKTNRAGDDLGSAFKDTGASGKGTATEGITGGVTKGRSTGNSQYGSDGSGLGDHRGVEVSAPGAGEFVGSIDKEAVRRVIRSKKDLMRNCYERELRRKPNLGGKVEISWRITAEGKAEAVKVKSSELNDPAIENCIVQEFSSWRFPEPPDGSVAEATFPFVFQSKE